MIIHEKSPVSLAETYIRAQEVEKLICTKNHRQIALDMIGIANN